MRTILIATDLSARSDRALDRALMLAREHGADLTVLHVVDDALPQAVIDRQGREAAEAIRAYLAARGGGRSSSVEVAVGTADREIRRRAAGIGADVVVLGAHRVGEADSFRGSTAWKVLRESDQPVLLVRNPALEAYRRVAVAFDFSVHSEEALRLAYRFRPEEVSVVHAYHVPYEGFLCGPDTASDIRDQARTELAGAVGDVMASVRGAFPEAVEPRSLPCHGEPLETLWQQCRQLRADLLAIGTHGRTGLAHAVFGSVAESLLRNPPCDVVAVRAVAERGS